MPRSTGLGEALLRIVRLAREMRWAIVASGTRWALAICRVVRPPTARRVSATAAEGESAGWQRQEEQQEGLVGPRDGPGSGSSWSATSRRCRALCDRTLSRCLRHAVVTSHANGSSAELRDPALVRLEEGLLDGVLGRGEVCAASDEDAEDPGPRSLKSSSSSLMVRSRRGGSVADLGWGLEVGANLDPLVRRAPPGPGLTTGRRRPRGRARSSRRRSPSSRR